MLRDVQERVIEVAHNAGVYDPHLRARVRGERVDRGAAREEVQHHLPRHVLRVGADAIRGDAVVGRRDDDHLAARRRCRIAEHSRRPHVQLFEPPERTRRLRQAQLQRPRSVASALVGRADGRHGFADRATCVHQNSIPGCAFNPCWNGCLISRISVTRSA